MLSPEVIALGRRVVELLLRPLDKVFFLSTGGESNEAALKIAKKVGRHEVVGPAARGVLRQEVGDPNPRARRSEGSDELVGP
jgi:acetylornithine/succinyldiaminopimelate/putrescine aminotransferase